MRMTPIWGMATLTPFLTWERKSPSAIQRTSKLLESGFLLQLLSDRSYENRPRWNFHISATYSPVLCVVRVRRQRKITKSCTNRGPNARQGRRGTWRDLTIMEVETDWFWQERKIANKTTLSKCVWYSFYSHSQKRDNKYIQNWVSFSYIPQQRSDYGFTWLRMMPLTSSTDTVTVTVTFSLWIFLGPTDWSSSLVSRSWWVWFDAVHQFHNIT